MTLKRLWPPLLLAGIFLAILFTRVLAGSLSEWNRAETAMEEGDKEKASLHYERCIKWYFPFNPLVSRAAGRLWKIGVEAERAEEYELALIAFQGIRSGFLAVRGIHSPGRGWIEQATDRLAAILARRGGRWPSPDQTFEERKGEILKKYTFYEPSPFWSLVMAAGLFGWIGGGAAIIASSTSLRRKRGSTLKWSLFTLLSLFIWILGLLKA